MTPKPMAPDYAGGWGADTRGGQDLSTASTYEDYAAINPLYGPLSAVGVAGIELLEYAVDLCLYKGVVELPEAPQLRA